MKDENFGNQLRALVESSIEIGARTGKVVEKSNSGNDIERMISFYGHWNMFGLVRSTVEKVIAKEEFSATEITEALDFLHGKLKQANDMDGLQEIIINLMKES